MLKWWDLFFALKIALNKNTKNYLSITELLNDIFCRLKFRVSSSFYKK